MAVVRVKFLKSGLTHLGPRRREIVIAGATYEIEDSDMARHGKNCVILESDEPSSWPADRVALELAQKTAQVAKVEADGAIKKAREANYVLREAEETVAAAEAAIEAHEAAQREAAETDDDTDGEDEKGRDGDGQDDGEGEGEAGETSNDETEGAADNPEPEKPKGKGKGKRGKRG